MKTSPRSNSCAHAVLLLAAMFMPPLAAAHEFWIEPGSFRATPGARVPLTLRVGQEFGGVSIPYLPEQIERFVSVGPEGERPLRGVLGDDPAGQISATTPGRYSIAVVTRPSEVIFDTGEEFERYLLKEGLEHQLAAHRARDKPGRKILESYFRCAKTLISVGTATNEPPDRRLGLPHELVAEQLPRQAGAPLTLRLYYRGEPVAAAQVLFMNKAEPKNFFTARTDREGRVRVVLPRAGVWLANSVYLLRAPFYAKEDWNSLWASLTFEVP